MLDTLPDNNLLDQLKHTRQRGRNDYPIEAMWRLVIAGIVFQHNSIASLLREAQRNPRLLAICGFDALPRQGAPVYYLEHDQDGRNRPQVRHKTCYSSIPNSWNMTRFLQLPIQVQEQYGVIDSMMLTLRHALMEEIPDLGRHLGYDGKALESHSTGQVNRETGKVSDEDADWGRKEYRGVDKNGKPWSKVNKWFGYRLHLIADVKYEIALAWAATPASHAECPKLEWMLPQLFEQTPQLAEKCRDFCADRGLDSGPLRAMLLDDYGIFPVIDGCQLWKEEKNTPITTPRN